VRRARSVENKRQHCKKLRREEKTRFTGCKVNKAQKNNRNDNQLITIVMLSTLFCYDAQSDQIKHNLFATNI